MPSQIDKTANKTNCDAADTEDNKHQHQRVIGNEADKSTHPVNETINKSANESHDTSDRVQSGSSCLNIILSLKFHKAYYRRNDNEKNSKSDKIDNRLRHKKRGNFTQKPESKAFHLGQNSIPPNRNRQ